MPKLPRHLLTLAAVFSLVPLAAHAQWANRYPKNAGYSHHVYLEGYELPVLSAGATDFAAQGGTAQGGTAQGGTAQGGTAQGGTAQGVTAYAFAARGWIWRFDITTGVATRLTFSTGGVDSRPAWSPDGRALAFVRDDSRTLAVMVRDMATGGETEIDRGMAMDPVFTPDGSAVVYANVAAGGDLDLWRYDLATRSRTRLTTNEGIDLRPQLLPDGQRMVYVSKSRAGGDQVRLRAIAGGEDQVLLRGSILSQTRPALSPDGTRLAYGWPGTNGWELRLSSVERPGVSFTLDARAGGRPIAPAFSADGRYVYFSESDAHQVARLYRIPAVGGAVEAVPVRAWNWGASTGRVTIETRCPNCDASPDRLNPRNAHGAARLSVTDAAGHPLIPDEGMPRFDGQNGRVFFYTPGTVTLEAPAGTMTIRAVRGLTTREHVDTVSVVAGETRSVTLTLEPLWQPQSSGYFSGDHHFHLNYGGPFAMQPADLFPLMQGEDLDVATPMLANLHNRFEQQPPFAWTSLGHVPLVRFAQEVRSHFLGHVGLLGTNELFWPWVWGPGYEVNGRDDRPNAEPLAFARRQGGAGYYVHPVSGTRAPFSSAGMNTLPVALVADAAHGLVDLLEVVCLWSNSVGTTELWYRLLNAGFPVAPSGGTDVMTDFYRTMAVGTTRVYVRPDGPLNWDSYFAALKAGRSFVTTGPMLDLKVADRQPGDVIAAGGRDVAFTLGVYTAVPIDSVALVVNGKTVWSGVAPDAAGQRLYRGTIRIPAGGWVAARALGPDTAGWPAMAEYAFAHTAPIWIAQRGSTDPAARRAAATELLDALGVARQRLVAAYAGTPIPTLTAYFAEARTTLEQLAK